ncbi:MAG TPA: GTP cyclohydrolase I FolE [Egibacteraceae bacterium]|jgi:GTP cyclohydrolase IA|nr:GTP cyclohydrolase I FolE [Egibacteraceae bacterium]
MTDSATGAGIRRPPVLDADSRVRAATSLVPSGGFDHDKIRAGVRLLLEGLGIDGDAVGVRDTPERVARMCDEIFAGLLVDPADVLDVVFEEGHDEIVMVRDIPLASVCEHHLVPFVGKAHVGYLPNVSGQVTGISKLARLVDLVAKRPNLQERLGNTIADTLEKALAPRGVFVMIEAEHTCMTMRGVRKPGAMTVTSAVRGLMRDDPRTRAEVLQLVAMGGGR